MFIVQLLVVKLVSLCLRKLAYGFCLDHLFMLLVHKENSTST
jgi:hypothetical protein